MNIWFDMDGTLADTNDGWWKLTDEEWIERVLTARGMINLSYFARLVNKAKRNGHKIGIITWLPTTGDVRVIGAKKKWLSKHLPSVEWDDIDIIPNGNPKWDGHCGLLFDDNEKHREEWETHGGNAFDVCDIFNVLRFINNLTFQI